jgi:hypothetical protein
MPVREPENFGNGFGGAGQGDGVGLMRGEPFVAGVIRELARFEDDFARQIFFKTAEKF